MAAALLASARAVVREVNSIVSVTDTEENLYTVQTYHCDHRSIYTFSAPTIQVTHEISQIGRVPNCASQGQDNTRLDLLTICIR